MPETWQERRAQCLEGTAVVANLHSEKEFIKWAKEQNRYVYIGRPSIWGNPIKLAGRLSRDEVCDLYAEHIKTAELPFEELKGMVLGCYCYPKRCHGMELAKKVNAITAPYATLWISAPHFTAGVELRKSEAGELYVSKAPPILRWALSHTPRYLASWAKTKGFAVKFRRLSSNQAP